MKNGVDLNNVIYNDVLFIDYWCNNDIGERGYFCFRNFSCVFVDFNKKDKDYFGDFLCSILIVYESFI